MRDPFQRPGIGGGGPQKHGMLTELGDHTELVKQGFGVAVHHVPAHESDLKRKKAEAIKKITTENDLTGRGYCRRNRLAAETGQRVRDFHLDGHLVRDRSG